MGEGRGGRRGVRVCTLAPGLAVVAKLSPDNDYKYVQEGSGVDAENSILPPVEWQEYVHNTVYMFLCVTIPRV